MQQPAVRLYVNPGCPFCAQAEKFLRTEQIPGDMVMVGDDPVLAAGIAKFTKDGKVSTPVLVSYVTGKVIVGWRPDDYIEIADTINRERRKFALAAIAPEGDAAGAPPAVAEGEAPKA